MADKRHTYSIRVDWTGNQGTGTSAYCAYSRAHEISAQGKTAIAGSSNPLFRGDAARWNPAELLIAALSACHQLWYLHLCADAGIVVVAYSDDASGVEIEQADGAGQFESVTLRPHAKLAPGSDENIARLPHVALQSASMSNIRPPSHACATTSTNCSPAFVTKSKPSDGPCGPPTRSSGAFEK